MRQGQPTDSLQKMKRLLHIFTLLLLFCTSAAAQSLQADSTATAAQSQKDSLSISLLTCSPGSAVYELYGHFALRVKDMRGDVTQDWVFNYGMFSFKRPHFIWHFVLGETDYQLGVVPYSLFYDEYARDGRGITEQHINLTQPEAQKLADALGVNLQPENATYRYNFFYDNCTTRALHMVESAVDGTVVWPTGKTGTSLRDIVHEFSARSPWNSYGQDLLLGAEADREADVQKQMFAPLYAQNYAEKAVIRDRSGKTRPFVGEAVTLLPAQPGLLKESKYPSPIWAFGILFVMTVAAAFYELRKGKRLWKLDALFLLAQGLTGCIIAFLFFFSTHPAVGSNWLVALFNPLPLLYLPWFMKRAVNRQNQRVAGIGELTLCAVTAIAGIAGLQVYAPATWFIIAMLALRGAMMLRKN